MTDRWELITVVTYSRQVSFHSANKSKTAFILDYILKEYPDIRLDKKDDGFDKLICRLLKDGWEPFNYATNETSRFINFRRVSNE